MTKYLRVKMKENLIMRYQQVPDFNYSSKTNELIECRKAYGWGYCFETKEFLKSIEGKIIDLVFTAGGDAFEKTDNRHWLPFDLWDIVTYV